MSIVTELLEDSRVLLRRFNTVNQQPLSAGVANADSAAGLAPDQATALAASAAGQVDSNVGDALPDDAAVSSADQVAMDNLRLAMRKPEQVLKVPLNASSVAGGRSGDVESAAAAAAGKLVFEGSCLLRRTISSEWRGRWVSYAAGYLFVRRDQVWQPHAISTYGGFPRVSCI